MKKILVVNLKKLGDVYSTLPLLCALKEKYPHCEISLLVYDESKKAASNITVVDNVYTIERKKILTYKKNDIYSDGLAFEQFFTDISYIKSKNWDLVINFSNDKVATFITSYLTTENGNFCGTRYETNGSVCNSDTWTTLFNEVSTLGPYSPFLNTDYFIHSLNLSTQAGPGKSSIYTGKITDQEASEGLNKIREAESSLGREVKLVGIQLKTSSNTKDIPFETLYDIVNQLLDTPEYYPVVLHASTEEERKLANNLNKKFNNYLVLVETDLLALPSIINQLDFLITPDTVTKHLADVLHCKSLEISLGEAPVFKQGSRFSGSLVLSYDVWKRKFEQKIEEAPKIQDIMSGLNYLRTGDISIISNSQSDWNFLIPISDESGCWYEFANQSSNPLREITYLAQRSMCTYLTMGNWEPINTKKFSKEQINTWCLIQKEDLTKLTKEVLKTLRGLKASNEGRASPEFIQGLEGIFNFGNQSYLSSLAVAMFKYSVENMNERPGPEQSKKFESYLFALKTHIQSTVGIIKELESELTTKVQDGTVF